MSGPALEGIRVLDLADEKGLPCTKFLADLGADVIKIEPPGGDPTRARPPFAGDISHPDRGLYFLHYNANKRGITLDVASADGQALFTELARTADVVVETFAPGTMESWGLGYANLAAQNPRIIVTSITTFGQTGPWKDYKGGELIAFSLGGLMALSGEPGGPPCLAPGEMACGIASMHAALATEVALYSRNRTGRGQHIDVSVAEAAAHVGSYVVPDYSHSKEKPERESHLAHGAQLHHDLYPCKDGLVRLFILDRGHWRAFVEWMGDPAVADPAFEDPRVRERNMHRISPYVEKLCMQYTKAEINLEAQRRHLAVTSVNTPAEFVNSEQTKARGFFERVDHPVVGSYGQIGAMHKYSQSATQVRCAAPLVGQHNDDVYRGELGLSDEEMAARRAAGVI
jgi:crotonobetainyl-CoA:carnitine CoA-transferase CaiB-like acyl-CoA transferase